MNETIDAPGFVRMVARLTCEGDCMEHLHNWDACRHPDTGEPGCCDDTCEVYEPTGNDQDVDALYRVISLARSIEQRQP